MREADSRAGMMAVVVKAMPGTKPSLQAGTPQPLFQTHLAQSPGDAQFQYDVSSDGKRFLLNSVALRSGGAAAEPFLNVVMNWTVGLKN